VWRYDQYLANAGDDPDRVSFWTHLKEQELETVSRLRDLIRREVRNESF